MRATQLVGAALFAWLVAPAPGFAELRLTITDGRVTLTAKDATLGQILAEWARVGDTKIVNLDRIPGGPMTIELADVSERAALDVLLRSLSGFVAVSRANPAANRSQFDRIVVMPTLAAPHASAAPAAAVAPAPQPAAFEASVPPIFNAAPQPAAAPPNPADNVARGAAVVAPLVPPAMTSPSTPTSRPTFPAGVAVPGVAVKTPPPPPAPAPPASPYVPTEQTSPRQTAPSPPRKPGG